MTYGDLLIVFTISMFASDYFTSKGMGTSRAARRWMFFAAAMLVIGFTRVLVHP